jgi:hypothetical protein
VNREKVEGYEESLDSPDGELAMTIIKAHPRTGEDDCADAVKTASTWSLELRAGGIAFTPDLPRVVMACGDEVMLSWKVLAPFLNSAGKREVAALQADLSKR